MLVACLLAGCGRGQDQPASHRELAKAEARADADADDDGHILCATGGAAMMRACTLSRETSAQGLMLTIQREDGGFRKLLVTHDGRGVIAADGAQPAKVSVIDPDQIEVALGEDRYRLPATVRSPAK